MGYVVVNGHTATHIYKPHPHPTPHTHAYSVYAVVSAVGGTTCRFFFLRYMVAVIEGRKETRALVSTP